MARLTLILSLLTALGVALGGFRLILDEWRAWRWKKRATGRWLLVLGLVLLAATSSYAATDEEQWCRDNAACVCSEPLNTTSYTAEVSNWGWDPGDSTLKPCDYEGLGIFIDSQVGWAGSNNSTILAALPSGHSVSYVLKGPAGHTGQWFMGHNLTGSDETAHAAWRMYVYFSSDYEWTNGTCTNSGKLTEVGTVGMITTNSNGNYGLYSFGGNGDFTPSNPDCCSKGPGFEAGSDTAISTSTLNGKWWRVEAHLIKRNATSGSPGLQFRMYMKDVTNNGTEYKVIDTSQSCSTAICGPGTGWVSPDYTTGFAPPSTLTGLWFDYFRNGTCGGYAAASHYVAAAWSSDSGQKIGAASEIEGSTGGGGGTGTLALFLRQIAPWAGITDFLVMAHLWRHRSQAVKAAVMIWQYAAYPKAWWWTYRYTRAVKKWQADAPIMLTDQRVKIIEPAKEQERATWL